MQERHQICKDVEEHLTGAGDNTVQRIVDLVIKTRMQANTVASVPKGSV
jgi:hypothetical protein